MTLIDQAGSISGNAESLREKGAVLRRLENVDVVRNGIEAETLKTLNAAEAMRALRSIDTAPSVGHEVFEQAANDFEKMLQGEIPILVADPNRVVGAINKIADARKSVTKLLHKSHSEWRDSTVGDLEPIVSFAEAVKKLWAEVHAEVTQLVSDVKKDRNELPTTKSLRKVTEAVERLHEIPRKHAPTDDTQRFLVAACGSGATFEDLTDPVREWLKDQGLERQLRVRISGSDDD